MAKKSFNSIFLFLAIVLISLLVFNCGDDIVNAPQDFISGTITYLDTNLNYSGGYYTVSIYGDSSSPFSHTPIRTDSLAVTKSGGVASAYYKITGLASGNYYIGSTWKNSSNGNLTLYGVYGCDQNINCSSPTKITFPNYAGTAGLSFKSSTH